MAVSTNPTDLTTSPIISSANSTATLAAKMTAVKNSIKSESKSFDELFCALAADVPSAHLTSPVPGATSLDAQTLLDEWLANDLQHAGLLAEAIDMPSLFSSPSLNGSPKSFGESPGMSTLTVDLEMAGQPLFSSPSLDEFSPMLSPPSSSSTSPLVTPSNAFEGSPVLDAGMNFFPDLDSNPKSARSKMGISPASSATAIVAQLAAAGAFNIPWGTEPATQHMLLHPNDPLQQAAALAAAQAAAEYRLAHANGDATVASINASHILASKRKTIDLDEIDPNDEVAIKRAKNTDAARRSRMKKVIKMDSLEKRVSELGCENSKLVLRVAVLEAEKSSTEARELEYERRIKRLEEQLREAHKALVEGRSPKE